MGFEPLPMLGFGFCLVWPNWVTLPSDAFMGIKGFHVGKSNTFSYTWNKMHVIKKLNSWVLNMFFFDVIYFRKNFTSPFINDQW